MTLVPAVLVLIVGSELIRTSVDRWFNAPMDEILSSANQIAERLLPRAADARRATTRAASRGRWPAVDLTNADVAADSRPARARRDAAARADGRGVPRRPPARVAAERSSRWSTSPRRRCRPATAARRPIGWRRRRSAGRPTRDRSRRSAPSAICCTPRRSSARRTARPTGVVVATDYLTGDLAARSRRMTQAFEDYNQLRVLKRPLTGVYLSFFLMVTLLILVGATWMGLYLAKRITRPGADAGGGRARDRRRPPRSARRAAEQRRVRLAGRSVQRDGRRAGASRRKVERVDDRARAQARRGRRPAALHRDDPRAHRDRRRLGRRAPARSRTINSAAARLLEPRTGRSSASRRAAVFDRADLQPLGALLAGAGRGKARAGRAGDRARARRAGAAPRRGRDAAASATPARPKASVLVLDDVTPLIRAQKVAAWREVARRLAHEIKNPLTPIQLSAERLRRHFAGAPPQAHARWSTSARRRSSARSSR